jgi:hypothetical protein
MPPAALLLAGSYTLKTYQDVLQDESGHNQPGGHLPLHHSSGSSNNKVAAAAATEERLWCAQLLMSRYLAYKAH